MTSVILNSKISKAEQGAFSHLSRNAKNALALNDKERIRHLEKIRWFTYSAADEILAELSKLIEARDKTRFQGMTITASANNGKSRLIRRFAAKYPARERDDGMGIDVPVLVIDAPPKADVAWMLGEIMVQLNVPYTHRANIEDKFRQVVDLLIRLNVKMLIVDEASDIISGTATKQREFLTTIKQIGTKARIPIILTGTPPIISAITIDGQTRSRFPVWEIPDWDRNEDFIGLLAAFEKVAPLKLPSRLASVENRSFAVKILEKGEGKIGGILGVLEKGGGKAILSGEERITEKIIDSIRV